MKILNKFIWSKTEPKNKNDVWFDGSVFRIFKEEEWQAFTINLQDANEVVKLKDFLTKYLSEEIIPAVEDAKEAVKTIQIYVDLAVDSVRQATEAVNKAEDLTSRAETVIPQAENVVRDITVFKDTIQGIWDNLYIEINNAISNANEAADRANNSIVFYPISDGDVSIIMGNLPRTDSFVEDYTGHTYVYNNTHGLWYLSSDLSICTQIPSIQSYNVEEEGRVFVQNISYVYNPETNRYEGQGLYGKLPIRLLLDGIEELGGQEGALFTNDGGHNMLLKTKQQLTDSEKNQVKENLGITGSGSYDDTEIKQNLTELSEEVLYFDKGETLSYTEVQGRVGITDSKLTITGSNWDSKLFAVSRGEKVCITQNIIRNDYPNFAVSAFIREYKNSTSAEIIRTYSDKGYFEDIYTPSEDGFIIVLYNISGMLQTEVEVYKMMAASGVKEAIAYISGQVSSISEEVQYNDGKVTKLNNSLNIYREYSESVLEKDGDGNYQCLVSQNKLVPTGSNYVAEYYSVEKGKFYEVNIFNVSYDSSNANHIGLVYFQEGEIKSSGAATILEVVNGVGDYHLLVSPTENGHLFVQTRIGDHSWTTQVKDRVVKAEFMDFNQRIKDLNSAINAKPQIHIASKVYAVVGDTLQLFYRGIMDCINIEDYFIHVDSAVGKSYPRYFEYTPKQGDVGQYDLTIKVSDNQGVVAEKTIQLIVSAAPSTPTRQVNIATFGDSLSSAGDWQNEIGRRLLSTDAVQDVMPKGDGITNVSLIGAMNKQYADYYGVGGWAWVNYATKGTRGWRFFVNGVESLEVGSIYSISGYQYVITEINVTNGNGSILTREYSTSGTPPSEGTLTRVTGFGDKNIAYTSIAEDSPNPLWDATTDSLSYKPYVQKYALNGNVDVIAFLLGWNILYVGLEPNVAYIESLISKAHEEYPSAKVVLMGVQLPSLNGGLGANYTPTSTLANRYRLVRLVHAYNEFLQNIAEQYEYVYYVDVASQFDSENNMPEQEHNVNVRNPKKELRGTNGVHPSMYGYYQIADVFYRFVAHYLTNL